MTQRRHIVLSIISLFIITACDSSSTNGEGVSLKVPQGLIAKAGARSVTLNWGAVASADRYTVYWSNNPEVTRTDSAAVQTTEPVYGHSELDNGSTYYYTVTSHSSGIESGLSDEVFALPQEGAPLKPTALGLKAEDGRITIDYNRSIPGVTQYQLLWNTRALNVTPSRDPNRFNLTTSPFVHDNLTNGQTYSYLLRVTNAAGKSTDSEIFQATPQAALPLAPIMTSVIASSGQAVLTWIDHSNAEGFDLYWSNSPVVTTASAYVRQVNSPFTHAPLSSVAEQHYYYRIQARNSAGLSPLSNEAHVVTPEGATIGPVGTLPVMPSSNDSSAVLIIRADEGQLTLDWSVGSNSAALAYNLYWQRGTSTEDSSFVLNSGKNDGVIRNIQPPYTHVGLQNNVFYYYRLSAINHAGESALSALTYAKKPERIEPGVPSGVAVLAADKALAIRWNPVDRADSYILTVDGITTTDVVSPHTLNGLNNGQTYTISLQSVTAARTSLPSQAVVASPQVARPLAPVRLLAISGSGQVQLQWDGASAPAAIDPGEAAISSYRVYRATQAGISPSNAELLSITPTAAAGDNTWQASVSELDNGQRYYFIVTALNNGGEGPASNTVWSLPQVPIPSAPSRLSARPGDNQVTLRFAPASDATGSPSYNLYWSKDTASGRSATQVITSISQSPDYIFSDANANGTTYYFKVSAGNPGGESVLSAEVSATPQIPAPQAMPTNVVALASSTQIDLSWDNVANAASYVVYWSTGSNIDAQTSAMLIAIDGMTSLSQTGLRNGQAYYYRIAARNAGGIGPLSPVIDALPQVDPPRTPNTFALVAGDAEVTINWAEVANAVSYRLYWRLTTESTWSIVQGVQSDYVHKNLKNAATYDYYLLAQNPGGNSVATATLQATPQLAPPAKPIGVSVATGNQQNSINWYSQTGLSYRLHWSTGTVDPMSSGQVLNGVSPITIHGGITALMNDQQYNYQVVASNADGVDSPPSAIVSATPAPTTAGAPTGLSALGGEQQITLNGFAPANAPADTTYTLYWGNQASAVTNTINDVNLPYVHMPLDSNQSYFYRITATVAGTESPPSNLARGTTKRLTPPPDNTVPYVSDMNISAFGAITIGKALTGAYRFNDDDGDEEGASILQWYRNGTALTDGTSSFYTLVAADAGQIIRFEVTPVAITGMSPGLAKWVEITVAPNNAAPVASAVSISGYTGNTTKVRDNLLGTYTYTDTENNDQGASLFQWRLDGRAITGATQQNYTVTTNDAGKKLTFEVTPVALTGASPGVRVTSLPLDVDAAAVITQNLVGMSSGILVGIDAATGNVTARSGLGLAGFTEVKQIGYDHLNKLIYGINILPKVKSGSALQFTQIVEIDPITSRKTVYGYTGPIFLNSVGIAVDPTNRIIYSLNADGDFYSYNLVEKTTSAVNNINYNGVKGLAIDVAGGGTLYTVQTSSNQLIAITAATASATMVNTLSTSMANPEPILSNPHSLSFDPNTNKIIAAVPVDNSLDITNYVELMSIDPTTAQASNIGGLHTKDRTDISIAFAYDPLINDNNTIYYLSRVINGSTILNKINLPAYGGQKIRRIPIPFRNLSAIVYDRNSLNIYAVDEVSKYVLKYTNGGVLSVAAQVNIPGRVISLAMDPARANTIYASNNKNILYSIDTSTWQVTAIGPFGTGILDMAFDPSANTNIGALYGITSTGLLVTINTADGTTSAPITITGTVSSKNITSIGFANPNAQVFQLHGVATGKRIYSIDPTTGVATNIDISKALPRDPVNITFKQNNLLATLASWIQSVDVGNLAGGDYVRVRVVEHNYPGAISTLAIVPDATLNIDSFYTISAGALYRIDPQTGLGTRVGSLNSFSIIDIAYNPMDKALYGIAKQNPSTVKIIYKIRTSGAAPLNDVLVSTIDSSYLSEISFDAAGAMYGISGTTTSLSELLYINIATNPAKTTKVQRLHHAYANSIVYNDISDDFIVTTGNTPFNLGQLSRTGETKRIAEFRSDEIAYQSATNTLYRLPDRTSYNANSLKTDLSTTPVMSLGKILSRASAYDASSNSLYMINLDTQNLLRIDQSTGIPTVIGYTENSYMSGLVYDTSPNTPPGERLLGYNRGSRQFLYVDPKTGIATHYPLPAAGNTGTVYDIAIQASTNTLYALVGSGGQPSGYTTINRTDKSLGTMNLFTDASGNTAASVTGITFDSTGTLYGIARNNGCESCLVKIDNNLNKGRFTNLNGTLLTSKDSKIGLYLSPGISMDKSSDTLYASADSGHLVSVALATGVGTTHGGMIRSLSRLVYSESDGITYATDSSANRHLYSINPMNGDTTFINGEFSNGIPANNGLAINTTSLTFYSADGASNNNLSIFNTTASLGPLVPFSIGTQLQLRVRDLEWNPSSGTLFGLTSTANRLFQITDLITGVGNFIGPSIGANNYSDLVYSNPVFLTVVNETGLLVIDASTGTAMQTIPLTGDLPAVYAISAQP